MICGCDLAKPQNPVSLDETSTAPLAATNNTPLPSVKDLSSEPVADSSLKLDQTFEDKEYGFRFSYPTGFSVEKGEGILAAGKLTLWFPQSKRKWDGNAVAMTVEWMTDNKLLSKTKEQMRQVVKEKNGSLQLFEKIKLDGQDCTHIKVSFGGMLDPMGKRVSEQYFLMVKQSDLVINYSAPADKFETFRPQFDAILKSFKIENNVGTSLKTD
ncbi:hypothetical protein FACS189427_12680 [Planctomycetales bacterium]|nr:hypothetical protein FACS189427_12680 [Planctomycetales bacterium]